MFPDPAGTTGEIREKERERQTDRQTHRQTDRDREREMDRDRSEICAPQVSLRLVSVLITPGAPK